MCGYCGTLGDAGAPTVVLGPTGEIVSAVAVLSIGQEAPVFTSRNRLGSPSSGNWGGGVACAGARGDAGVVGAPDGVIGMSIPFQLSGSATAAFRIVPEPSDRLAGPQ